MWPEQPAFLHHQHDGECSQRAEEEAGGERHQRAVVVLADGDADADAEQRRDRAVQRRGGAGDVALRLHRQRGEIPDHQAEGEHHRCRERHEQRQRQHLQFGRHQHGCGDGHEAEQCAMRDHAHAKKIWTDLFELN